ncbi:MAG TPA: hypothetical protein VE090_02975, partial [Methylomirabilota bacterium]|nr:hypothetical protein [Methylomirabilota bacterium]
PSPTGATYCTPQNLQTLLTLSPAAGNIYGTFTIKNISQQTCQIIGNNDITPKYNTQTVTNINISRLGISAPQIFQLSSGQTVYSQVHYPNGPQCSTGIQTTPVTFSHQLSPQNTITFANQNGTTAENVTTCKAQADITTMQIWNLSSQPITP